VRESRFRPLTLSKILNDAKKNNNKVIVVYDSATGEKNVVQEPSNSRSLEFETVEVISRDSVSLRIDRLHQQDLENLTQKD
jgi:hypothetical protein